MSETQSSQIYSTSVPESPAVWALSVNETAIAFCAKGANKYCLHAGSQPCLRCCDQGLAVPRTDTV